MQKMLSPLAQICKVQRSTRMEMSLWPVPGLPYPAGQWTGDHYAMFLWLYTAPTTWDGNYWGAAHFWGSEHSNLQSPGWLLLSIPCSDVTPAIKRGGGGCLHTKIETVNSASRVEEYLDPSPAEHAIKYTRCYVAKPSPVPVQAAGWSCVLPNQHRNAHWKGVKTLLQAGSVSLKGWPLWVKRKKKKKSRSTRSKKPGEGHCPIFQRIQGDSRGVIHLQVTLKTVTSLRGCDTLQRTHNLPCITRVCETATSSI